MTDLLPQVRLKCLELAIQSITDTTDINSVISISKRYETYIFEQQTALEDQGPVSGNVG